MMKTFNEVVWPNTIVIRICIGSKYKQFRGLSGKFNQFFLLNIFFLY